MRSALLPVDEAGAGVLALSARTDGATTSTLWRHSREAGAPAVKLASIPDADARRLRCLAASARTAALAGRIPCLVTGFATGSVDLFVHDPAAPTAALPIEALTVGAGAPGAQFGSLADGSFAAVVSNFGATNFNLVTFDADGKVAGNRAVALPAGCSGSAHAAPFNHGGRNYVAGSCHASGKYFVVAV